MEEDKILMKVEKLVGLPFWNTAVFNGLLAKDLIDVALEDWSFGVLRFIERLPESS